MKEFAYRFRDAFISSLEKNYKFYIAFSLILMGVSLPYLANLKSSFGVRTWFRKNDPNIEVLNNFEKTFGNDEAFVLALEFQDKVFTPENLRVISLYTEQLWLVTDVARVDSLTNYHWTYANGDEMITEEFLPEEKISDLDFIQKREKEALAHRVIPGYLISRDAKSVLIYGHTLAIPDREPNYEKMIPHIESIDKKIREETGVHFSTYSVGPPVLNMSFRKASFKDLEVLTPILLLFVTVYLLWTFRSILGVILPLAIILGTLCIVGGIAVFLGMKFNSLTFILPSIVIAIGIADSVHLLNTFFDRLKEHGNKDLAIHQAMEKNFWPIFLTSFSTAIGFFSLIPSDIVPVSELGLLAGMGTLIAFFLTCFLLGPLLHILPVSQEHKRFKKISLPKEKIVAYVSFIERHAKKLVFGFTVASLTAFILGMMNEINSNPYDYFTASHPITKANHFVLDTFKGAGGPELKVDSGVEEGVKDPTFLRKVDLFQEKLLELEYTNKTISIVDVLKEVNQALMGGGPEEYRIHENRNTIAEELFLYNMGLPEGQDIKNRVGIKNRFMRISVLWNLEDSKDQIKGFTEIEQIAKDLDLNVHITGKPSLFHRMNDYVVMTFFSSMGFALLVITVLLIFVFSSLKIGLLSLIPNFVPIAYGAGILTILDKPIDVGCAIVASVTLGIAVDDTIHFLSHYNLLVKQGKSRREAIIEVLDSTGVALIITTLILVSCFGLFMFGDLVPNINFGILCALVLTMALVCDLVFLPAILLMNKRKNSNSVS